MNVGDKIGVTLSTLGTFTLTAQVDKSNGLLIFMFDDCIKSDVMNSTSDTFPGYVFSDLMLWLNNDFLFGEMPVDIRKKMVQIGIPSIEMIFGESDKNYESAEDQDTFELMTDAESRKSTDSYWLMNTKVDDETQYAIVNADGELDELSMLKTAGIRPVITMIV